MPILLFNWSFVELAAGAPLRTFLQNQPDQRVEGYALAARRCIRQHGLSVGHQNLLNRNGLNLVRTRLERSEQALPYLLLVLIIVAIPDVEQLKQPKLKAAILLICMATVAAGYFIGTHHNRFITCHDFEISGNFVPENCHRGSQSDSR